MNKKQLILETLHVILSVIFMLVAWIFSRILSSDSIYVLIFYGLAFIIGGYYKAVEGIKDTIENKSLNVEILMIIAAIGAFIVNNYAEGAILIFIFALSGVLESFATARSEKALTSLLTLAPQTALLLVDGETLSIPVKDLNIGDQVVVKVGDQVPIDGIITDGSTSLDQAAITGEFIPVSKYTGDQVYAGSMNIESSIVVKTTVDPKETVVQKIIDLVQNAQNNKTHSQSLIDKIEKYYVYIVILLSILMMLVPVWFGWLDQSEAFRRGIVVLVVGSPCALVASITPAMLSSLSFAAHKRILIKNGKTLEDLYKVDTVLLDKTGTITTGIPKVVKIKLIDEVNEKEIKNILYTLEKDSNHPLAQAISNYLAKDAKDLNIKTNEISGRGMQATINEDIWKVGRFEVEKHKDLIEAYETCTSLGHTTAHIIKNDEMIGFIALMDTIREHAVKSIDQLNKLDITTYLMTGDNLYTAKHIAKDAHVDHYIAECFPEDKANEVMKLQKDNHQVIMVGDGINDAPALAQANVGIAMGAGTDVTLETADIIFMNDNINDLPTLIDLSKRMRSIVLQNIIFSISVIVLLMVSNVFGLIELPIGVIFHEGSTILVILNSLRLLK